MGLSSNTARVFFIGFIGSLLASCLPANVTQPEISGQSADDAIVLPLQTTPSDDIENATEMQGNSRLSVTLSCQTGNLPGRDVGIMPVNAYVAVVDEGYQEDFMQAALAGVKPSPFLTGETGEDGIIDFTFKEDREYHVVAVPMDDRFETQDYNVSNLAYKNVMIARGETIHKNFVLAQAYCDKDSAIRAIGSSSFVVADPAYTSDYEKTAIPFGVDKQYYWRSSSNGAVQHVFGHVLDRGASNGFSLANNRKSLTIANVQSETHIQHVCAPVSDSVDMYIREDHALGIQDISGTIGESHYSCRRSYMTKLPVTYEANVSESFDHSSQNLRGLMSIEHYPRYRNSCDDERLAKALLGPASFEASCLSVETRAISIYEPGSLASHAVNTRVDLSRKELSEGKVP